MKMKSIFIQISLLLFSITTQINSYFIRGSIYEKDGQFIVVLGDMHFLCKEDVKKQRTDLINSLKNYSKESTLMLVEDQQDFVPKNDILKDCSPMSYLTNLKQEGFNVINADKDCRKMLSAYLLKYSKLLIELFSKEIIEKQKEIVKRIDQKKGKILKKQFDDVIEKSNVTFEDVLKEFNKNIKMTEQYEKEIRESDAIKGEIAIDLLGFYSKTKEEIIEKTKDDIDALISQEKQDPPSHMTKEEYDKIWAPTNFLYFKNFMEKTFPFLDINIIHTIIKNRDKKGIFICVGAAHTFNIEKFLTDHYKLIEEVGINGLMDLTLDLKPINVGGLLSHLPDKI